MNILVIKQTSLGDVLHSTGHIRAIKQQFPDSHLTLLTANSSAEIYRHNPWIDQMILVDRYRVKHNWLREPLWSCRHMRSVMREVQEKSYDLAFDLQGLAKSVLFLYAAKADAKYVKGNWVGLEGFRQPELHAIKEMDGVLKLADIDVSDTSMEFATSAKAKSKIDQLLSEIRPDSRKMWIFSAFSRWPSKDWPLRHFAETARAISDKATVLFTGAAESKQAIDDALGDAANSNIVNLAGQLSLGEFAELVHRADGMLTGDSFPMHVACAQKTPVIALFAPTDERKVGPTGPDDLVIRAPDCRICDRKNCQRGCLARILPEEVVGLIEERVE